MRLRRYIGPLVGFAAGIIVTGVVVLAFRARPPDPVSGTIPVEDVRAWAYDKDGVWIGDLRIRAQHPDVPYNAPGVSARIRNDTANKMIVAVFVVLLDEDCGLVASTCLSLPAPGIISPGATTTAVSPLPTSRSDIERIRFVRLRVTRAAVHRIPGGSQIL